MIKWGLTSHWMAFTMKKLYEFFTCGFLSSTAWKNLENITITYKGIGITTLNSFSSEFTVFQHWPNFSHTEICLKWRKIRKLHWFKIQQLIIEGLETSISNYYYFFPLSRTLHHKKVWDGWGGTAFLLRSCYVLRPLGLFKKNILTTLKYIIFMIF